MERVEAGQRARLARVSVRAPATAAASVASGLPRAPASELEAALALVADAAPDLGGLVADRQAADMVAGGHGNQRKRRAYVDIVEQRLLRRQNGALVGGPGTDTASGQLRQTPGVLQKFLRAAFGRRYSGELLAHVRRVAQQ